MWSKRWTFDAIYRDWMYKIHTHEIHYILNTKSSINVYYFCLPLYFFASRRAMWYFEMLTEGISEVHWRKLFNKFSAATNLFLLNFKNSNLFSSVSILSLFFPSFLLTFLLFLLFAFLAFFICLLPLFTNLWIYNFYLLSPQSFSSFDVAHLNAMFREIIFIHNEINYSKWYEKICFP